MEPITHLLTGAVLARAGFNQRAAYATVAMVVGAEFPDTDMLWSMAGPIAGFQHHRGITHTFLGIIFEAALLTAIFYGAHLLRKKPTKAPANWTFLFFAVLVALLSHLFLDWTNNYGLRPLFPFDPHWYAGSFVYIFEPVLFLLLLIGLLAPALFGLIDSEVGASSRRFRGRGWAIAAMIGCGFLWSVRFLQHDHALQIAAASDGQSGRFSANPYPIDPFTWHIVGDSPGSVQLSTLDSRTGAIQSDSTLVKPVSTLAMLAAKRSPLGEVYLDWSQYPIVSEEALTPEGLTPVLFRDGRFMYSTFLLHGHGEPLSGVAFIDMNTRSPDRVDHMELGGRIER